MLARISARSRQPDFKKVIPFRSDDVPRYVRELGGTPKIEPFSWGCVTPPSRALMSHMGIFNLYATRIGDSLRLKE